MNLLSFISILFVSFSFSSMSLTESSEVSNGEQIDLYQPDDSDEGASAPSGGYVDCDAPWSSILSKLGTGSYKVTNGLFRALSFPVRSMIDLLVRSKRIEADMFMSQYMSEYQTRVKDQPLYMPENVYKLIKECANNPTSRESIIAQNNVIDFIEGWINDPQASDEKLSNKLSGLEKGLFDEEFQTLVIDALTKQNIEQ